MTAGRCCNIVAWNEGAIKSWGVDALVTTCSDPGHVRVNGKVADHGHDHGTLSPDLCWSGIVLLS